MSAQTTRAVRQPVDALQIGFVLGGGHALVETTLLGVYGVRLTYLDVGVYVALFGGLGGGLAVGVWSLLLCLGVVTKRDVFFETLFQRRVLLALIAIGYPAVVMRMIASDSSVTTAVLYALFLMLVTVPIALILFRHAGRTGVVASSLFCLSVGVYSVHLFNALAETLPQDKNVSLALSLAVPFVFLFLFVQVWARRVKSLREVTPAHKSCSILLLLFLAALGLWFTMLPLSPRWAVRERNVIQPASFSGQPDIVLLVLDTVRSDHLDLFGYQRDTMPYLSRFAREECFLARETLATSPDSVPSHASMFTGMYPHRHGAHKPFVYDTDPPAYSYHMRKDVLTLAEFLNGRGYHTVGVSANFGPLSSFGLDRGFSYYDVRPGSAELVKMYSWFYRFRLTDRQLGNLVRRLLPYSISRRTVTFTDEMPPYRRAEEINDIVFELLQDHTHQPLFLFLNYFDAHTPYLPVPEFDQTFVARPDGVDWKGLFPSHRYKRYLLGEEDIPSKELEFLKGQYDAELLYLDRQFHRLIDHLKRIGRYENTLIIVVGDHGEAFLEHGVLEHSKSVYQPEIQVPLLVKLPTSLREPALVPARTIQFVDILPTIADLLAVELPEGLDGSAWGARREYALAEVFCHYCIASWRTFPEGRISRQELVAVATGDYKLIRSTHSSDQVYDLTVDPKERHNLVGNSLPIKEQAQAVLDERNQRLVQTLAISEPQKALLERLRSLGYVN